MDLLREVREALTDASIPLSKALLKAKVLASTLRSSELRTFVDRELRGYREDEEIPDYRRIAIDSVGTFINRRFTPVTDHPVPESSLPEELREYAQRYDCAESVGAIEHTTENASEHMIWMPWPSDAVAHIAEVNVGGNRFRCTDASRCFSTDKYVAVRNRVLDIVLDLAEKFPADQVSSEEKLAALPSSEVLTVIHNHIEGDFAVVGVGGTVHQQSAVQVTQNDLPALMKALDRLGVSETDRKELESAISEDSKETSTDRLGPRVKAWIGTLATKVAEKSAELGAEAIFPLAVKAIRAYLGL